MNITDIEIHFQQEIVLRIPTSQFSPFSSCLDPSAD